MTPKAILFLLLAIVAAVFCCAWARDLWGRKRRRSPTGFQVLVGVITDFLDTLGVGSYATTTSLYRLQRGVADEEIPGTLTIGHAIPTITQAFIYITFIEVDFQTLALLIGASVLGAWLGAGVVTRLPRRGIQIGMAAALLAAAVLMLQVLLSAVPKGGQSTSLEGPALYAALFGNFWLGALMTIGIGAYAPIMIMVSLLGMNEKTAFPIMMGSCAFLMPIAALRFIRRSRYNPSAALGLAIGGVPAVLLAAFLVKEIPLRVVRWLVVIVVFYAAASLLRAALAGRDAESPGLALPIAPESNADDC